MENRRGIYYWKCDRPSAFFSLNDASSKEQSKEVKEHIDVLLTRYFGQNSFVLRPSGSQGNHIAYIVDQNNGSLYFLRIENGPESDNYMEVEARVMNEVRRLGVPVPEILAVDASRKEYPFAYQLMEFVQYPDLNKLHKEKKFNEKSIAHDIGKQIATYQHILPTGYGLFDPIVTKENNCFAGLYSKYDDYFFLNLEKHLRFLVSNRFMSVRETEDIMNIINMNAWCLEMDQGCLVHKDMALWNLLGTSHSIKAVIDWDDSISGDPADDISLLACFHPWAFIEQVMEGYKEYKEMPENFSIRFWMHLLRNMIVKAVIRLGAGYFDRDDAFFLIGTGQSGDSLRQFTQLRIRQACMGLHGKFKISAL